jgi:nitrite reductase/ring-hydroxylating ferredoxin subunit
VNRLLCTLSQLPEEGGCREFRLGDTYLFAVKHKSVVFVYRNRCPHIGTPLNWQKDKFLNSEREYIQCFSHGALFEITTGFCVAGPCHGQSLERVDSELNESGLYITV